MSIRFLAFVIIICSVAGIYIRHAPHTQPVAKSPPPEFTQVKCWSGGTVIYEGVAIGAITFYASYTIVHDRATNTDMRIQGPCIFTTLPTTGVSP